VIADLETELALTWRGSNTTFAWSFSPSELSEARTKHPLLPDRDGLRFFAEVLAALPELRDRLRRSEQPVGLAIVDAAIAVRHVSTCEDRATSKPLRHRRSSLLDTSITKESFKHGIEWASEQVSVTAALLNPEDEHTWHVFDAVAVDATEPLTD
jgi:hypothetical protein